MNGTERGKVIQGFATPADDDVHSWLSLDASSTPYVNHTPAPSAAPDPRMHAHLSHLLSV